MHRAVPVVFILVRRVLITLELVPLVFILVRRVLITLELVHTALLRTRTVRDLAYARVRV